MKLRKYIYPAIAIASTISIADAITPNNIQNYSNLEIKSIDLDSADIKSFSFDKLELIEKELLSGRAIYKVDMTGASKEQLDTFKHAFGMVPDSNLFLMSLYKGSIKFTIIPNQEDIPTYIDKIKNEIATNTLSNRVLLATNDDSKDLIHKSFYLDTTAIGQIPEKDCTFTQSIHFDPASMVNQCDRPNISLVYKINLVRSLAYGAQGSPTPDAKIVRISIDSTSSGNGIHLHSGFNYSSTNAPYKLLDGWQTDYSTGAMAQSYEFDIKADNDKAMILSKFPMTNINTNYEKNESSSFTYGFNGSVSAAKDPSVSLGGDASYTETKSLSYNTQNYAISVSSPDSKEVSYKWQREQYPTAKSLLTLATSTIWYNDYSVDESRIGSIAYKNFVPNFDVIYMAQPSETGVTTFTIDNQIEIRPIYTSVYKHYYVVGGHYSWQGQEREDLWKKVNVPLSFDVDWDALVFMGAKPVNLQFSKYNDKCMAVGDNQDLHLSSCDNHAINQSFIYVGDYHYRSAKDTNLCLDAANLKQLQQCNSNLSQRWSWQPNGNELLDGYKQRALGINSQDTFVVINPKYHILILIQG